jgi:hypothetical protein
MNIDMDMDTDLDIDMDMATDLDTEKDMYLDMNIAIDMGMDISFMPKIPFQRFRCQMRDIGKELIRHMTYCVALLSSIQYRRF